MPSFRRWFDHLRKTPPGKRSRSVFDHQIFWAESLGGLRLRSDISERANMKNEAAQKRWDFFHRPDPHEIDRVDAAELREIRRKKSARNRLLKRAGGLLGLSVLICGGLALFTNIATVAGVFAVLAAAVGLYFLTGFTRDAEIDDKLDAVQEFRQAIDGEIEDLTKTRLTVSEMRLKRDAAIARECAAAAKAAGIAPEEAQMVTMTGWAGLNDAADVFGPARRRRAFVRAGGLFAVYDLLIAAPIGDRLHVRRAVYDAITDSSDMLEEWELRLEAAQIGQAIRRDISPTPPPTDPNEESSGVAKASQAASGGKRPASPPPMCLRELVVATPARSLPLRAADSALFNDLIARQNAALKALEKQERKAAVNATRWMTLPTTDHDPEAPPPPPEVKDPALESSRREAERTRLQLDLAELREAVAAETGKDVFNELREALYGSPMTMPSSLRPALTIDSHGEARFEKTAAPRFDDPSAPIELEATDTTPPAPLAAPSPGLTPTSPPAESAASTPSTGGEASASNSLATSAAASEPADKTKTPPDGA
ncbi:MAG: hypothetical protein KTR21_09380 [Rhodobacteraceae bacterium]|nr:hypothetical protein [Paracoccaceae bacterium]